MSEAKFTKGEWRVEYGCIFTDDYINDDCEDNLIADCMFTQESEEELANAHLMAAAPDMYGALLLAMESIDPNNKEALDTCNAVLAKARGEL